MADRKLALTVFLKGVDTLSGPLRNIVGASGGAAGALRRLNDTHKTQKAELKAVRAEMQAASGNITHLLDRERALEIQMARTTRNIDNQKRAASRLARARAMGDQATSSGRNNLATGAAIGAPLLLAGKAAADFQDGMTDIQQKADLTDAATARLQGNIMAAAKAAKQLPENMRLGVDALAGFGMTPEQAAQMMAPIGKAATAYRAEIDDLSKSSFANFDNLKVPVNQTAKALDIMAVAGKSGAFELKDMAQYFPALTASAQGLGQTGVGAVADLSAALQIARKGAGDSATAANNVQNLLAKINTKDTIKNFKEFGIDLPAAMKKAYAEGKTPMEAIAELTKKATKGDMSKLAFLFGDMQVQQALRPLIANMDEYRKIRADALAAAGTVEADFAKRAQNANVQARALTGNLTALAITAGTQLLPPFVQITGQAIALANKFSAWAEKNPKLAEGLIKAAIGLAGLNIALGAGRILFGSTIGPLVQMYNAFDMLRKSAIIGQVWAVAAPLLTGAFTAIRAGVLAFSSTLWTAGAALLANPITWIVLGIVAAVALLAGGAYLIYKNWGKISAWFGNLWTGVKGAFAKGLDWLKMAFFNFTPLGLVIKNWQPIMTWLSGFWDTLKGAVAAGVQLAISAFMNFSPLGWVIKGMMAAVNWLRQIDMLGVGKNLIDGLINGIVSKYEALKSTIKNVASGAVGWFRNLLGIHSPSRVFAGFGGNISEGLRLGIERTMSRPMKQARTLAAGVAGAAAVATGPAMAAAPVSMTGGNSSLTFAAGAIVINAAPGMDEAALARLVGEEIDRRARQSQVTRRSAFKDDDA